MAPTRIYIEDADTTADTKVFVQRSALPQTVAGLTNDEPHVVVNTASSGIVTPTAGGGLVDVLDIPISPAIWTAAEMPDNADTRQVRVVAAIDQQVAHQIGFYVGTVASGVVGEVQLADRVGANYVLETAAQTAGAIVHTRVARRVTSPVGAWEFISGFADTKPVTISNVPAVPVGSWATLSSGSVRITLAAPNGRGRTVTGGEYRIDGGAWTAFAVTTALDISGLTNGVEADIDIRWLNVNGAGASLPLSVTSASTDTLTITGPTTLRVGDTISMSVPVGLTVGAVYRETCRADRINQGEWFMRLIVDPGHVAPMDDSDLGCYIRMAVAEHDGSGDFVQWHYSNILGPVNYEADYIPESATIVSTLEQLATAAANPAITFIAMNPGVYPSGSTYTGLYDLNRSASPLTIASVDPVNRAMFDGQLNVQGSANLTMRAISIDRQNNGGGGSTCIAIGDFPRNGVPVRTRNCSFSGFWIVGGPRWAQSDIDYPGLPYGYDGQLQQSPAWKIRGAGGTIELKHMLLEFTVVVELTPNETIIMDDIRQRGSWMDNIRIADADQDTAKTYIRRFLSFDCLAQHEEGPGRMPHWDFWQFLTGNAGEVYFDHVMNFPNYTRTFNRAGSMQGAFSSGLGNVRQRVRGCFVTWTATQALSWNGTEDMTVANTSFATPSFTGKNGAQTLIWDAGGGRYGLRGVAGVAHALGNNNTGSFNAGTMTPVRELGDGLYQYDDPNPIPFRGWGGAIPNRSTEWMQAARPLPGYEDYGCITADGYLKPVAVEPSPITDLAVTRDGVTPSTLDVTFTRPANCPQCVVRWKPSGGVWNPNYLFPTGASVSVQLTDVALGPVVVEAMPLTNDYSISDGAWASVAVAGEPTAPSISVTRPLSVIAGATAVISVEAGGFPTPTISVDSATFDGQTITLSRTGDVFSYDTATGGDLVATFRAANGVGSDAVETVTIRSIVSEPTTAVTFTAAPTATDGQLLITVPTQSFDADAAEIVLNVDGFFERTLVAPPTAGAYTIGASDGLFPGVQARVTLYLRNALGEGPRTEVLATPAGAGETLVYSDTFAGLAAGTTLQSQTLEVPAAGAWTRFALSTQSAAIAADNANGLRGATSTGTQLAHYTAGTVTGGGGVFVEAVVRATANPSSLSTRLYAKQNADNTRALQVSIGSSGVLLLETVSADGSSVIATHATPPTLNADHTVRLEVRPNSQRVYLDGVLVINATRADADMAGLGDGVGLGFRNSSGQTYATNGFRIKSWEAGILS